MTGVPRYFYVIPSTPAERLAEIESLNEHRETPSSLSKSNWSILRVVPHPRGTCEEGWPCIEFHEHRKRTYME
jgi:hypothetical protein